MLEGNNGDGDGGDGGDAASSAVDARASGEIEAAPPLPSTCCSPLLFFSTPATTVAAAAGDFAPRSVVNVGAGAGAPSVAVAVAATSALLAEKKGNRGMASLLSATELVLGSTIAFDFPCVGVAAAVACLGCGRCCRLWASAASNLAVRMYSRLRGGVVCVRDRGLC